MTTSRIMYALAEWVNGDWEIDWAFPLSYTAKERLETVARMNSKIPGRYAQIAVEVTVVPTALPVVS